MPMKPHEGESQSDFMKRCVPEMMGDGKREQDQAVAACMNIWRDKAIDDDNDEEVQYADPGYQSDGKKRYRLDAEGSIRAAWSYIDDRKKLYTDEQLKRIKARIAAAWKDKIDPAGPTADDKKTMSALRRAVVVARAADCPEPDDGESYEDFIDRCVDEMTDDADMDEDEAEEACVLAWDEYSSESAGAVMHKTRATPATGMQFILSDATPDRFGDIVEPKGWKVDNFQKNPIALFNHDKSFVIGKWTNLQLGDTDLRAELTLAPKGTSQRIDEIRRLIEADILRAVSVGFRPLEYEPIKGSDNLGVRYMHHELVECSLVAVPANPNALSVAKSLNISPTTVRMVFGESASSNIVQRAYHASRGEHADDKRGAPERRATGEHAETHAGETKGKPMLLSKRIEDAQKHLLGLQDQLNKHLEGIDDENVSEEQMVLTEDLTAKIETANRHLTNLKAIEAKNGSGADDAGDLARRNGNGNTNGSRPPAELAIRTKKLEPLDFLWRAALVRCKSRAEGQTIDDTRRKIYGDDERTRVVCDLILKAASAPAETTVTGWAAELVRQIYADFMQVLLPLSCFPKLSGMGLALTFGANGRIIIPTRNLTPSIAGSFVGEGQPIPVRQGQFASQTITPKKMAVITTWTREMDEHSIPAIEGLLRQAVLEDTAIALDTVLLDNNPATTIRPAGLRSYQAGLTASAAGSYAAFVADYKALYGSLLTLTNGNVRRPAILLNPHQTLDLALMQPPAAAAPLWPFQAQLDAGRVGKAELIESATVPPGTAIMVDAADFTTAGADGPRLEISDQATLHMEDTTPADIVSGPSGTPVPATPVKSMWQTDSLALRLIMRMNWLMRRPMAAWMTGVSWA